MSKYDGATIEIVNWDKFNGRKDVKSPTWFKFSHSFFEDHDFYDFTTDELLVWVYFLCLASRKSTSRITINLSHAIRVGRIAKECLTTGIEKLIKIGCIKMSRTRTLRGRYAYVTDACAREEENRLDKIRREEIREEENRLDSSQSASASELEFNLVEVSQKKKTTNPLNAETWEAYQEVYKGRYKQDPTRNASVNAMISNFVKRIGEDAPDVAAFYVRHNKAFYVQNLHQVKFMLSDAEALHTQWKNGQQVLSTTGRDVERLQHNSDVFQRAAERIAARKDGSGE